MFAIYTFVLPFSACDQATTIPEVTQELTEVEDIPTPNQDREDSPKDEESDDGVEDTGFQEEDNEEIQPAETLTYAYGDADSLLYVQVWKDESSWGSDLAHNHVMRASNWSGNITYNVDDPGVCEFDFSVPVADLMVDESAMREYVGYGDTINEGDRNTIRQNMLASNQLDAENFPTIDFESTDCTVQNSDTLEITGDMTIRGTTTTLRFDLDYLVEDDRFYAAGEIDFTHADFDLQPYSAFGGVVRNDEPLRISYDMVGFAE